MEVTGSALAGRQLRSLLEITLRRHEHTRIRTYPFTVMLLNLGVCVYVDQFLQNDLFHGLSLFLLAETSFGVLCLIVVFNAAVAPVLDRTRILPVDRRVRFLFTLLALIRHPLTLGWSGSTMLFLLVLSRYTVMSAVLTAVLVTLFVFTIITLFSLRVSSTRPRLLSIRELVLMMVTATFLYIIISLMFSIESPAEHVPLISWTAHGIASGRTGDFGSGIRDLVLLTVISVLSLGLGFLRRRGG